MEYTYISNNTPEPIFYLTHDGSFHSGRVEPGEEKVFGLFQGQTLYLSERPIRSHIALSFLDLFKIWRSMSKWKVKLTKGQGQDYKIRFKEPWFVSFQTVEERGKLVKVSIIINYGYPHTDEW